MSTEQTLYVIKILLKHISEHPEDASTVASGALSILDGAQKQNMEHDKKQDKPKSGAPKKDGNEEERQLRYREDDRLFARRMVNRQSSRRAGSNGSDDSQPHEKGRADYWISLSS